jgi:hypothetical protein
MANFEVFIVPLLPHGTNSTMFTQCCEVAITDSESNCPHCGKAVIGSDAPSNHARAKIRWSNATRQWKRNF